MIILTPAFSSSLPRSARIVHTAASLQLLLRELSVWALQCTAMSRAQQQQLCYGLPGVAIEYVMRAPLAASSALFCTVVALSSTVTACIRTSNRCSFYSVQQRHNARN